MPRPVPLLEIPQGTVLWRVHDRGQPCDRFVESESGHADTRRGGRFDPLPLKRPVPVLYTASSPHAAIAESLVQIDSRGVMHPCRREDAERKAISKLLVQRPISVVAFHGLDVHRFPLKHRELAECGQRDFPATRAWAALFRDVARSSQGLAWISRQDNTSFSYVFWGDRVGEEPVEAQGRANPLYSGSGLRWLNDVLERMGVELAR